MEPLGETQNNVLEYIAKHIRQRGYSPSLQDISGNIGLALSVVHYHVTQLERKGHIVRERNQARSIRLAAAEQPGWNQLEIISCGTCADVIGFQIEREPAWCCRCVVEQRAKMLGIPA